jgi:sugar/nucleoside kinase (ribokinase family)
MRTGKPVFVTRGAEGIVLHDGRSCTIVPPVHLSGPVDTVGAGDAALSGIASALAAGATLGEAAEMGNFAGAVTAKKLKETGTATPGEILELAHQGEASR